MCDIIKKNMDLLLNDLIEEERKLEKGISCLYDLIEIEIFTNKNQFFRMISSSILADVINIKKVKNEYIYTQNDRHYKFKCLSDFPILKADRKILQNNKKKNKSSILRSIRIALSKKLPGSKLITILETKEKTSSFNLVVEYEKSKKKYIIDYSKNLVMEKDDYNALYLPKEVQTLTQGDLYLLMNKMEKLGRSIDNSFMFLFGNELLNDPKFGVGKYDKNGIHKGNYFVLNDEKNYSCFDYGLSPIDIEIKKNTENPQKLTKNIT